MGMVGCVVVILYVITYSYLYVARWVGLSLIIKLYGLPIVHVSKWFLGCNIYQKVVWLS